MKTRKIYTKRPMDFLSVRVKHADVDLLRTAAARAEVSQSEFLRQALREKARRTLLVEEEQRQLNQT